MCDYQGPAIINSGHGYACTDGHLHLVIPRWQDRYGGDVHCPCPACNLDGWVREAQRMAAFWAFMTDDQQPHDALTAWLCDPIVVEMHGTKAWDSAARQGLLWTFVLEGPSAGPGLGPLSDGPRAPAARVHWPWPLDDHLTSAHTRLAIRAAAASYTPPADARQDAQGFWTSPLHPTDAATWNESWHTPPG